MRLTVSIAAMVTAQADTFTLRIAIRPDHSSPNAPQDAHWSDPGKRR